MNVVYNVNLTQFELLINFIVCLYIGFTKITDANFSARGIFLIRPFIVGRFLNRIKIAECITQMPSST